MNHHWPHAPVHKYHAQSTYMITGATLHKQHYFHTADYLNMFQNSLFHLANQYKWQLKAWSLFSNHYHLIAHPIEGATSLQKFIQHLHNITSINLNKLEKISERKIWFQYWDTQLTYINSYLPRLKYVMHNPVKHNLVTNAEQYPWCSLNWFNNTVANSYKKTVMNFKVDSLNIRDDF